MRNVAILALLVVALLGVFTMSSTPSVTACGGMTTITPPPFDPPPSTPPPTPNPFDETGIDEVIL